MIVGPILHLGSMLQPLMPHQWDTKHLLNFVHFSAHNLQDPGGFHGVFTYMHFCMFIKTFENRDMRYNH